MPKASALLSEMLHCGPQPDLISFNAYLVALLQHFLVEPGRGMTGASLNKDVAKFRGI